MKLLIPEGYHDITITQYFQVKEIYKRNKSEEIAAMECVALLCGVTPEAMRQISHNDLMDVVRILSWLWKEINHDQFPLQRTFVHNGVKYGFIPDMSDLTVGEFADLDAYSQNGHEDLHKMMSVLYRPVTHQRKDFYEIRGYDPKPQDIVTAKDFKMDIALGAMVFFYNIAKQLSLDLGGYLKEAKVIS